MNIEFAEGKKYLMRIFNTWQLIEFKKHWKSLDDVLHYQYGDPDKIIPIEVAIRALEMHSTLEEVRTFLDGSPYVMASGAVVKMVRKIDIALKGSNT